ncbi:MAG: STAS domain-containing protein [Spongiibacteraceae bacterium]|nr:STAS domain-containing protein [Spongiibacteraceae bacterium]
MALTTNLNDGVVTIILDKQFDFDSVDEFRAAYSDVSGKRHVVDFRNTDYMDSSGLGMLLNMRRFLGDEKSTIKLINCRPQVKKVLKISRFETKFEIS